MLCWSPLGHPEDGRTSVWPLSHHLALCRYLDSSGDVTYHDTVFRQMISVCYWPPWLALHCYHERLTNPAPQSTCVRHWTRHSEFHLFCARNNIYMTYIQCRSSKTQENQQRHVYDGNLWLLPPDHKAAGTWWNCELLLSPQLSTSESLILILSHFHFARPLCGEVRYWLLRRS